MTIQTARRPVPPPERVAVVLGAGGLVGIASEIGVLRALGEVGGIDVAAARLLVGTSAGSVVSAYLRTGHSAEALWGLVTQTGSLPEPSYRSPLGFVRRLTGSAFVLARSAVRVPIPPVPAVLGQAFPAGLLTFGESRFRLETDLPDAWPDAPLWLCGVDIFSGRRVVLGREGEEARAGLAQAVRASCAVPGLYPPVRVGRQVLVDGGTHSTTNLDLVAAEPVELVVVVAPMAYDPADPPGAADRIARRLPTLGLAREAGRVERSGIRVLRFLPSAEEVRVQGFRLMRNDGLDAVAHVAYERAAESLHARAVAA